MNEPVKDLVLIEPTSINAATLFTSDTAALDLFLKDVETKAMDYNNDVSTAANRKKIASQAYKVTQSKVFLDNQGKALTKNINDSRKYLTDCLDKLKDRVRAPLTDWEAEEAIRLKAEADAAKYQADWDEALKDHKIFLDQIEINRLKAELAKAEAERIAKEKAEAAEAAAKEAAERAEKEKAMKAAAEAKAAPIVPPVQHVQPVHVIQPVEPVQPQQSIPAQAPSISELLRQKNDAEHKNNVRSAISNALIRIGIEWEDSILIVDAIDKGQIPRVSIQY